MRTAQTFPAKSKDLSEQPENCKPVYQAMRRSEDHLASLDCLFTIRLGARESGKDGLHYYYYTISYCV